MPASSAIVQQSLSTLPTELVSDIFDKLLPSGPVSLALACNHFYAIFKGLYIDPVGSTSVQLMEPICCTHTLAPSAQSLNLQCTDTPCQYIDRRLWMVLQSCQPFGAEYGFQREPVFKFLKTSIYGGSDNTMKRGLIHRYNDYKLADPSKWYPRSLHNEGTTHLLPEPFNKLPAAWDAAAIEMIKDNMKAWDSMKAWEWFWWPFNVYHRYRNFFHKTRSEMLTDPSSTWNAEPGAGL
jgi:hypothetical protein